MPIEHIAEGDTDALDKMNATITEANKVAGKAALAELAAETTARQAAIAQEASTRQAAIAQEASARQAAILALPLPMPVQHRPGDAPLEFGQGLPEGEAMAEPVASALLRYDENGKVVRLAGDGVLAPRHLYAVEPGRRYLVTFVVQRRVNSPDPDNDAIRCALAWYGQGKGRLPSPPQTVVQDVLGLATGSGRQVVRAVVSRAAGSDVDIVSPAGARYVRPYVQTYGTLVQSDVEVINWTDVTDAVAFAPDVSALDDRVTAVESLDLGARVNELESQVTAPNEFRVATIGDLEAATVPVTTDAVLVLGFFAPADGGGARYKRVALEPSHAGKAQSSDGAWWELAEQRVCVEMFGAMAGLDAGLAAANASAFASAFAFVKFRGGGEVDALDQFYAIGAAGLRLPGGVKLICSGARGEWEPIFPERPKTWEGTNLVFCGTGTKDRSVAGTTSMKRGGGWRPDPDNPGEFFKLTSFYDDDATGTTPATLRQFSVAVTGETDAQGWGIQGCRVVPWIGVDGIAGYSDTGSASLGDDWDIGVLIRDGEYCTVDAVQSVGSWREFGFLQAITTSANSRGERSKISRCRFQGRVGLGIRAPDRWACTTPSTSSVQITWSEESYWPSAGSFRGSDNATYTYTGTVRAGVSSEYLQFTGVTPNPTGIFHIRHPSTGIANTEYHDVITTGLDHVSGDRASDLGLADSKALEASGFPLRAPKFFNFKSHTGERVIAHFHDAADFTFYSPQFEGGGRILASPANNNSPWATGQVGETRNLIMVGDDGLSLLNLGLFTPRSGFVQGLQLAPSSSLTAALQLRPLSAAGTVRLQDYAGVDFLDAQTKTFTPAFRFVTVTSYTTQTGRYIRIGDYIFFELFLNFTGLDTADTSAMSITLPITGDLSFPVSGQINERTSTGINMSTLTRPYLDLSTEGHLSLSHSRTTRVAYNTASIFSASGILSIIGSYKAGA